MIAHKLFLDKNSKVVAWYLDDCENTQQIQVK